jgi:hypothetical protein
MPSSASRARKQRAVKAEPLSAPKHELAGLDAVHGGGVFDDGDRVVGAAAQGELPADDLAGAAVDDRVQVRPAVLGDPDARHVELPDLPRPLDAEEAWPLAPLEWAAALDQLAFPHHPRTRLRLTGTPSFRRTNAVTIR